MKKVRQYNIKGVIELLSGTRIGGSDDILQIGGTDLTCIKDPVTGKPYIPGSSLKGKMRSCLEKELGIIKGDDPCGCGLEKCPVCRIFGPHKNTKHSLGPTRIIVRDAICIEGGQLELKTESTNKRSTGGAQHPRTMERVVPGSKFQLQVAVQVYDIDNEFKYSNAEGKAEQGGQAMINVVCHAIDLIVESGIGSGTSRGSGAINITLEPNVTYSKRQRLVNIATEG